MKEPEIEVGILSARQLDFTLLTPCHCTAAKVCHAKGNVPEEESDAHNKACDNKEIAGKQSVQMEAGGIRWNGQLFDELLFTPIEHHGAAFEIAHVTIGIGFHWEQKENQRFQGSLRIIREEEQLTAINIVSTESYLTSVISSEMSAQASLELLKAHAIISRSWLLAQHRRKQPASRPSSVLLEDGTHLRWYERDAHTRFDVCADDHCQRYQGVTRASTELVSQAVRETCGQVLMHGGEICDARFSKCCGGALEEFPYCWADEQHPYLKGKWDTLSDGTLPDLTSEAEAERWIRSRPQAFCHTQDKNILEQVLNTYDQATTDFFRWQVTYTQQELSELIHRRSGTDYGTILDLIPVARGVSGRLWKLTIVGSKCTNTIGKELEIRRTLSPSHLYSSAFVVDKEEVTDSVPARFTLTGAGWGHGVGLCQIGAAVMGEQGYSHREILLHYYSGASIEKLY